MVMTPLDIWIYICIYLYNNQVHEPALIRQSAIVCASKRMEKLRVL